MRAFVVGMFVVMASLLACVGDPIGRGAVVTLVPETSVAVVDLADLDAPAPDQVLRISVLRGDGAYSFTRYAVAFFDQKNAPLAGVAGFEQALAGPVYVASPPDGQPASVLVSLMIFDPGIKRFLAARPGAETYNARVTLMGEEPGRQLIELVTSLPFRRSPPAAAQAGVAWIRARASNERGMRVLRGSRQHTRVAGDL